VTPASAVVSSTLALTLGGRDKSFSFSRTVASVTSYIDELITAPLGAETQVFGINGAAGTDGLGALSSINYLIVYNTDDTNFVRLRFKETGGDTVDFKLLAGEWMIFNNTSIEVNTTGAAFSAFVAGDYVGIQPDTAAVDVQVIAFRD